VKIRGEGAKKRCPKVTVGPPDPSRNTIRKKEEKKRRERKTFELSIEFQTESLKTKFGKERLVNGKKTGTTLFGTCEKIASNPK